MRIQMKRSLALLPFFFFASVASAQSVVGDFPVVEANTAGVASPNILTASECGKLLTNEGSTAENYHTLPSAVVNCPFHFYVQDADGLRVTAATGDTIRLGTSVSATAGYVNSFVPGASLTLTAINATEWVATEGRELWAVDGWQAEILGTPNPRAYEVLLHDCWGGVNAGESPLFSETSGADSNMSGAGGFSTSTDMECFGQTGTTTTGRASAQAGTAVFGSDSAVLQQRIVVNALSDGTDTFTVFSGWNDSATDAGVDSVAFRYTHSENTGNWTCYTRSNSTESTADSGTAVVAGTYYRLGIAVNPSASSARFFINNSEVCTINTNIPSGLARVSNTRPLSIVKSAGITNRTAGLDYVWYVKRATTPR